MAGLLAGKDLRWPAFSRRGVLAKWANRHTTRYSPLDRRRPTLALKFALPQTGHE